MNSLKKGERHMLFMSGHFSIADCLISKIKNVCRGFTPAKSDQFSLGFLSPEKNKENPELGKCENCAKPEGLPHTHFI